jgi:isopenicillin N synthase-like dioxygenase
MQGNNLVKISHTERLNGEPVLRGPLQAGQFEIFALASTCHDVIIHLYKLLTVAIKVDSAELDRPSDTGLKLCYKAATNNAEIAASKEHTDSGLITLLFYDQYTLEIWDSSEKRWKLVEPKEGCAIVNIADVLQVKSGGRLHSPLHRVVQPKWQCKDRYSAVYFLRP